MKSLLLKNVYSNLIYESILDQSTFIEKLLDIAKKNQKDKSSHEKILSIIIKCVDDTKLLDLKGKENKKARKKAELVLAKELKKINGLDGTPIDIKGMRPLYDSIIQYLLNKSDVSLDDCINAADYYMKDFYRYADKDEKSVIDAGSFDFEIIFRRTKFYQQYQTFKKEVFKEKEIQDVYEDENIKIVYPTSPAAFNAYIKSRGALVGWCTQNPTTWYNYHLTQFVMILSDKHAEYGDKNFLISLKVNFDGSIDYEGTCDYYNSHMGYNLTLLNDSIESDIANYVKNNNIQPPESTSSQDVLKNIEGLIDLNEYEQIEKLYSVFINYGTHFYFEDITNSILEKTINTEKYKYIIGLLADVFCNALFVDTTFKNEFNPSGIVYEVAGSKGIIDLGSVILEKASNKRNHEKYYISFTELFDYSMLELILKQVSDVESKVKNAFINACNTNNHLNFKRVLKSSSGPRLIKNIVMPDSLDDIDIFKSKGFFNYISSKNLSILAPQDLSQIYTFNTAERYYQNNPDELYIRDLILNNKEEFSIEFEVIKDAKIKELSEMIDTKEKNSSHEDEISNLKNDLDHIQQLSLDNVDINVIISYILSSNNIEDVNISDIIKHSLFLDENSTKNIIKEFLTDFDTFVFLCEKNMLLKDKYLNFIANQLTISELITKDSVKIINFILEDIVTSGDSKKYVLSKSPANYEILKGMFLFYKKYNINFSNLSSHAKQFLLDTFVKDTGSVYSILKDDKSSKEFLSLIDFLKEVIDSAPESALDNFITGIELYFDKNKTKYFESNKVSNINYTNELFMQISSIQSIVDKINNRGMNVRKHQVFTLFFYASRNLLNETNTRDLTSFFVSQTKSSDSELFNFNTDKLKPYLIKIISNNKNIKEVLEVIYTNFDINSFYNRGSLSSPNIFKYLTINLILAADAQSLSFNKQILSKIISHQQFLSLTTEDNLTLIKNLVTTSSEGESNYLFGKDLVTVRDCLVKFFKINANKSIISEYKKTVFSMIKELNRNARIQLSDALFRDQRQFLHAKTEEELNDAHEALLRKYLSLLIH